MYEIGDASIAGCKKTQASLLNKAHSLYMKLRGGMSSCYAEKRAATRQVSASRDHVVPRTTRRLTIHFLVPLVASIPSRNRKSYGWAGWRLLGLMVNEVIDGLERLRLVFVDGCR